MKKGLFILTLALLLALLLAGTALAGKGDVDLGDAVIYVNGVELEVGEYWRNGDIGPDPSNDEDDWNAKFEFDAEDGYILTLDEAEITKGYSMAFIGTIQVGIFYKPKEGDSAPLTIVLKGENIINIPVEEAEEGEGPPPTAGIAVEGDLLIEGDELIINGGFAGITVNVGDLAIDDAEITMKGGFIGILSMGEILTIDGADITIEADAMGIAVMAGGLTVNDAELNIEAGGTGIFADGKIEFNDSRADVKAEGIYDEGENFMDFPISPGVAIISVYTDPEDNDDEGIVLINTVILQGGQVVPVYEGFGGKGFLLEAPAAGQPNLYGSIGDLEGWTFSEEDELTAYDDSLEGASTHVILGDEDDADTLLNLGIAVLGVGRSFPFVDVPANHWAYQYIFDAVKQNLINGKTADLYGPDASLTYAEAIKLAACIRQLAVDGSVTTEPGIGNPWYAPYVSYAELNSIIAKGQFSDKYNQPVSRYDFALIFANAMPEGRYVAIHNYTAIKDVPAGNAYLPYALKLYNAGIITGQDAAGSFNGQTNIKRSEVAAIVIRMVDSGQRL